MRERTRHKIKMGVMITLTFGFFLVEIVVGYMTKSLALVSDSFHMISDVLALIIGLVCICLSTKDSKKNTYGYARAEVMGALINSVFLIALCFSIFIEAIQRLVSPEGIKDPDLLLIVGGVGLGVNVIGLMLFCNETIGHGHSHGGDNAGHGHSHGGNSNHGHSHSGTSGHGHSHSGSSGHGHSNGGDDNSHSHDGEENRDANPISMTFVGANASQQGQSGYLECIIIDTSKTPASHEVNYLQPVQMDGRQITNGEDSKPCSDKANEEGFVNSALDDDDDGDDDDEPRGIITTVSHIVGGPVIEEAGDVIITQNGGQVKAKKTASGEQMNIQGVFLHILGDALGSVVVIVSALIVKYVKEKGDWVDRIDPLLSILMVIIILASTIPLFRQSCLILLQNVPKNMNVNNLVERLKTEVEGLANVHDLHVWQLVGSRVIASMHIRCTSLPEYVKTSKKIKSFFHENGIHSTTIQPEFTEHKDKPTSRECYLECGPELQCFVDTCCSAKKSERMKLLEAAIQEEEHQEEQRQLRELQQQQPYQEGTEQQQEDHSHDHNHDHDHDHHHDHDHDHHHGHDHHRNYNHDKPQHPKTISIEVGPVPDTSDSRAVRLESSESRL